MTQTVDEQKPQEKTVPKSTSVSRRRSQRHKRKSSKQKRSQTRHSNNNQILENGRTSPDSSNEAVETSPNGSVTFAQPPSQQQSPPFGSIRVGRTHRRIDEVADDICGPGKNKGVFHEWIPRFPKLYGYSCLFRYATKVDYLFMAVGLVSAVICGACIPGVILIFGICFKNKVLIERMHCDRTKQACTKFLKKCNESDFRDVRFKETPLDAKSITEDCISSFLWIGLAITAVYTITSSIYYFCWNYTSQRQGVKMRSAYFKALLKKENSWFDTLQDPEAINRTMENTRLIVEVIGESFPMCVHILVMCVCSLCIACWLSLALTGLCLVTLPLYLLASWLVYHCRAMRILKERRAYRIAHDLAIDVLSKMRTVIGYTSQAREQAFYQREIGRGNRIVIGAIFLHSLAIGLHYTVCYGMWALVFYGGMWIVSHQSSNFCSDIPTVTATVPDASEFTAVIMSVVFFGSNVETVWSVLVTYRVARLCCVEVFQLIDSNPVGKSRYKCIRPPGRVLGKVEFDDVRFCYPGNAQKLALNRLSFVVEPNTTIGLVGLTDTGKSTVLKLICKEYLASTGFIKIDGVDIRALDTKWLRSNIGVIPQDLVLFDNTIEENVRMGKLNANYEEIVDACKTVGAHEFIINFKNGYQTYVGHKGNRLTPCQRQLIIMARAIIRNPRILLLDEPTQDLDTPSLKTVMKCLGRMSRDRTVIIVAHRLSTIVHANCIYVLKNGRVVESGTHMDLIKREGPYSQLCKTNRGSNSFHRPKSLDAFDTSEMTIVSCWKTFYKKPALPSLYTNTAVDPVNTRVIRNIMINKHDTERGYHARLDWTLSACGDQPSNKELKKSNDMSTLEVGLIDIDLTRDNSAAPQPVTTQRSDVSNDTFVPSNKGGGDKKTSSTMNKNMMVLTKAVESRRRTLTMASTSPGLIFFGVLFSILMSVGIPLFPCLFALTVDVLTDLEGNPDHWRRGWRKELFSWTKVGNYDKIIIYMGILAGVCGLFGFLHDFLLNLAGYRAVKTLRKFMYSWILNQDMSFFEDPKNTPITLASILFQDTDAIRHITYGVYGTLVQCISMLILSIVLCILLAPKLAGYTVLSILIVAVFPFVDAWLSKKQHGRLVASLQQRSLLILKVFQWKHVITICQLESHYQNQFTILEIRASLASKRLRCARTVTFGLAQSAVFWGFGILVSLARDSILQRDQFFNIVIILFIILFSLITIGTNFSVMMGFRHVSKGSHRMMEILKRKPLVKTDDMLNITRHDCSKEIEFINAYFWKPLTPDTPLLRGINVRIEPKRLTAIVGYSDSGKAAFLELLGRYYNVNGGMVVVGGNALQYSEPNSLRENLSVVPQTPELFNRTVAQNIAIGAMNWNPSMMDVIEAAKEADVHNLIVSLPEGYETRVSGEHDYLSTAHKQKICIARALMKRPKIIIFDEVTTNLDREGEEAVLQCIRDVMKSRTVIMISQRLQPVMLADWIIVMEKGFLQEQGRHQELLIRRPHGVYANMWRSQHPMEDELFLKGNFTLGAPRRTKHGKHVSSAQDDVQIIAEEDEEDEKEGGSSWCSCF